MPILNYTTQIDSYKTIIEIQQMLSRAGATKIIIDNREGEPVGLTFCIQWGGMTRGFSLPCNSLGVWHTLQDNKDIRGKYKTKEQARRVAWRIVKDWISAQLAIVEAQVAELPEVFLPYAITEDGSTLFDYIESKGQRLLQ